MNQVVLLVGIVIMICVLMGRYISKLAVPSLLFFIALGMLFGVNGLVRISFDDYQLTETICSVSLIFIIFYGGFGTNIREARPVAIRAVLLSTAGVALTAGSVGVFAHWALRLPWLESLLIGAVLSSTDAASVFNILRSQRLDLKYHTASLLELESGSNDPISYMLTVLLVTLLAGKKIVLPVMLLEQVGIGLFCGIFIGKASVWALRTVPFNINEGRTIFTAAVMLLGFALPQMFGGNGYLSVYLCGIILGNGKFPEKRHLVHFFDVITGISQILIFFLLGLLVTPSELPQVLLPAVLIMLFLTFAARPAASMICLLPFRSNWRQIAVVSWSGLRGAASIVFSIMAVLSEIEISYNLYNLVFCIVLLSIAVQGTLLPYIARKTEMIDHNADVRKTFNDYEAESSINFIKTRIDKTHRFCDQQIKDIVLPSGMLVVMVIRGMERIIPNGETILKEDDLLILAAADFSEEEPLMLQEKMIGINHKWIGRSLRELQMPKNTLIVTIKRGEETFIPTGSTRIYEQDLLIIAHFDEPETK